MIRIVINLVDDGSEVLVEKIVTPSAATPREIEIGEGVDAMVEEYMNTVESFAKDVYAEETFERN